jgi:hypothetical protein
MNNQFKPGDLALVIAGGHVGETASLIRFVEPGEVLVSPTTGKEYQFRPTLGVGGWLCKFRDFHAIKHEKNLMPLRGDFQPEHQKSQELVH